MLQISRQIKSTDDEEKKIILRKEIENLQKKQTDSQTNMNKFSTSNNTCYNRPYPIFNPSQVTTTYVNDVSRGYYSNGEHPQLLINSNPHAGSFSGLHSSH